MPNLTFKSKAGTLHMFTSVQRRQKEKLAEPLCGTCIIALFSFSLQPLGFLQLSWKGVAMTK